VKPAQRAAKIRHTLQKIQEGYQVGFAGQPRLTRAAGQLDAWVAQLKGISPRIKTLPPQIRHELTELLRQRIDLYQREASSIRESQQMNAVSRVAYGHIEWANLHGDRYQRHFAGQSRNTRDGSLLSDLTVEAQVWLEQAQEHFNTNQADLTESATQDLEDRIKRLKESEGMYQKELKAITEVQKPEVAQEHADLLAYLANQCFQTYRAHFAGKSRQSRNLSTLERINTQLEIIGQHMEDLISTSRDDLEDVERVERNLKIVTDNLTGYQAEEQEIDNAQQTLDYSGWVKVLGDAAQSVYDEYSENFANKSRQGCDPVLLCHLCDRLYDIAVQLRPFVEYSTEREERGLLLMMLDQLRLYHREYNLVREATQDQESESDNTVH
jgi:hypothetical protein